MKVPTVLNPTTNAPNLSVQGIGTAERTSGAAIGQGVEVLAHALERHKLKVEGDQANLDKFELDKAFLEETNTAQLGFKAATEQADPGEDFASNYAQAQAERHGQLIEEMKQLGYKPDALHDFDLQLTHLRGSQFGQALTFQNQLENAQAGKALESANISLSQYHLNNPMATETVKAKWDDFVDNQPHLSDVEREKFRADGWDKLRTVGAQSLAESNPGLVISNLDPHGIFAKQLDGDGGGGGTGGGTAGGTTSVPLTLEGLRPLFSTQESHGDYTAVNKTGASGRWQVMPATGKALAAHLGIPWQPALMKQETPAARAYQDKIGNAAMQASIDAGHGDAAAIFSHYYSGSTTAYLNPQGNPKTAKYVQDMLGRAGVEPAPLIVAGARQLANGVPETVGTEPITVEAKPSHELLAPFRYLTGPEILRTLSTAYSSTRENSTEAKAAARVEHENRVAALGQGQNPGAPKVSDEQGVHLFGETNWGQMKGEEVAARAGGTFMVGMGTASATQVQTKLAALKPVDPKSSTYKVDLLEYEGAHQAAEANLAQRESDPVNYVYANFPRVVTAFQNAKDSSSRKLAYNQLQSAYQQLGISPDKWLPFPAEQVKQMAQSYDGLNPAQKLGQLDSWFMELPEGLRTPFVRQVNKEVNGHLKEDTFLYSLYRDQPDAKALMSTIFEGQMAIREDPARKPSEALINKNFASSLTLFGLTAGASANYNDAAAAIYVARGGRTDGPKGLEMNAKLYEDSLRMALGGTAGNKETGYYRFHGAAEPATILPPGVTKSQWEARLHQQTLQTLTNHSLNGMPPLTKFGNQPRMQDIIDDGVFVMRAPGRYIIKFAGQEGFLHDRLGRDFTLVVK